MRIPLATNWFLGLGALLALPLSSCTTSSNLSALSQANQEAGMVREETIESPHAQEEPAKPVLGNSVDDDPVAIHDPVAQRRPEPTKPAYTLASVPLTSVETLPTNQIMMIRTTAYSHLQADSLPYGRKSAAGTNLQYGNKIRSAAADWSKYPLGTKFQIEGLPYIYVVDDYGSALCGTETIDIYKPNLSGIGKWGVRNVPIRVLEWGSFEESAKILRTRTHVRHAHHVRKMLSEIERKGRAGYLTPTTGGSA